MLATCSAGAADSLTPKGRNPTLVSGRELPREQRTVVQPDEKIAICAYTLRIQPK